MLGALYATCHVPRDLASVTARAPEGEHDPHAVGVEARAVEAVWRSVIALYRTGIHPAIQICVRRDGRVILHRAIGHARGNGPADSREMRKVRVTTDTPFNLYSASKAVTAMVVHLLDQRRLLHLDDTISHYIPEYASHGKARITIRQLLTHRAGVPSLPRGALDLDHLHDPDWVLRHLIAARPAWRPGRVLAYHAISGGFLIGEVVRRITGKTIRDVLRDEILAPLGFRWGNYGVAPEDVDEVALGYFTGPPALPPLSTLIERALGMPIAEVVDFTNDPRFLTAIVPGGNVVTTANELSRFYQLLLDGGEQNGVRIFDPRTIARATSEQSYLELDLTLGFPLRYGIGFMLGASWLSPYGPDTEHAFGHVGFTNVLGWADPARGVAAALMTSGKPLVYPGLYHLFEIGRRIGTACSKR